MDSKSTNGEHATGGEPEVPQLWKVTLGGADPIRYGAQIELRQQKGDDWVVAVRADSQAPLFNMLPGFLTRSNYIWSGRLGYIWSGKVQVDTNQEWFLSFTMTQRPDDGRRYLYGILLGPLKPGSGQEQGTWGAEEENPV